MLNRLTIEELLLNSTEVRVQMPHLLGDDFWVLYGYLDDEEGRELTCCRMNPWDEITLLLLVLESEGR